MNRSVPIIKLYQTLIVSIQTEVDDDLAEELKEEIAHEARIQNVDALIVEVSGIDVFDSYIAKTIRDLAQICRLMGARTVLVGLDPGMAITLTEMGMEMTGVDTALNLEHALELFGGLTRQMPLAEGTPEDDGSGDTTAVHNADPRADSAADHAADSAADDDPLTWVLRGAYGR